MKTTKITPIKNPLLNQILKKTLILLMIVLQVLKEEMEGTYFYILQCAVWLYIAIKYVAY